MRAHIDMLVVLPDGEALRVQRWPRRLTRRRAGELLMRRRRCTAPPPTKRRSPSSASAPLRSAMPSTASVPSTSITRRHASEAGRRRVPWRSASLARGPVCTAAVDKRARELALSAFDEYMAGRIDAAEFDRQKAEARAKATAEHAPLTAELEPSSAPLPSTWRRSLRAPRPRRLSRPQRRRWKRPCLPLPEVWFGRFV
jgi:hypothetical protein